MRVTWDYVAGFFDGEGNVYARMTQSHKSSPGKHLAQEIRFTQADRQPLERIQRFLNCGTIHFAKSGKTIRLSNGKIYKCRRIGVLQIIVRSDVKRTAQELMSRCKIKRIALSNLLQMIALFEARHLFETQSLNPEPTRGSL